MTEFRTDKRDWTDLSWPRPAGDEIKLIVIHRTGNPKPGATAEMNLNYFFRTRKASIHHCVDSDVWWNAVPHDRVAWHVSEFRVVKRLGYDVRIPSAHRRHGDVQAIGIEVCENRRVARPDGYSPGQKTVPVGSNDYDALASGWPRLHSSPSQTWEFDDATYTNLVNGLLRLRDELPNALPIGHGHLDPWTRNTDPFGLMPDGWHALLDATEPNSTAASPPVAPAAVLPAPESALAAEQERQRGDIDELDRRLGELDQWRRAEDARRAAFAKLLAGDD